MARRDRAISRPEAKALLSPYLDAVAALNSDGRIRFCPGSPLLVRAWLRPRDRLIACEFEPRTAAALGKNLTTSTRAKVLAIDGWTALSAYCRPRSAAAWC
jgi:23S rRNA (adenine2030-N6)-methyltransferase